MVDRVVVLRVGKHLLSMPFDHVDEILSTGRAVAGSDLPKGVASDDASASLWVSSRGRWLSVRELLPGQKMSDRSQILVVTCDGSTRAIIVDQVLGIERTGPLAPLPKVVEPYMEIPFAGVRFLKDRPVLELDLSRLISVDIGGVPVG